MNVELLRGMSDRARKLLEALDIGSRPLHDGGLTITEATVAAQDIANETNVQMVVGWQINDVSGDKEAGFCPRTSLEYMTLEPVGLVYPR